MRRLTAMLALSVLSSGCGDDPEPLGEPPSPEGCPLGELPLEDGGCVPAGLPADMLCPPGDQPGANGSCSLAGNLPDECAEGFEHDGDRRCLPVLPPERCPPGLLAVPGDPTCREIADCGSGPWGDIPVDVHTQFVDGSYGGGDGDGSEARPWTTIQQAVGAAAPGAIVAIAAGSYQGDLSVVEDVQIWGRCPSMVELVGVTEGAVHQQPAAVYLDGVDSVTVRGIAIAGVGPGVYFSLCDDVLLADLWIHDTTFSGVAGRRSTARLQNLLIEETRGTGLVVEGVNLTVEGSLVRTARPASGQPGRGLIFQQAIDTGDPTVATVIGSVIEDAREAGLFLAGAEAAVQGSVIRGNGAIGAKKGVQAQVHPATGLHSTVAFEDTLVEGNHGAGVLNSGGTTSIVGSVFRDTQLDALGHYGMGVVAQAATASLVPGALSMQSSVVERNGAAGIMLLAASATIGGSYVADTAHDADGLWGRAITVQYLEDPDVPSDLWLEHSTVERSHEAGVSVMGSTLTMRGCAVRDTVERPAGGTTQGMGLYFAENVIPHMPAGGTVESTLIERSIMHGLLMFGSHVTMNQSVVRSTMPSSLQTYGDGVCSASGVHDRGGLTLLGVRIEQSDRAAASNFGSYLAIGGSALVCQAFDLDGETYEHPTWAGDELVREHHQFEDLGGNGCGCPEPAEECLSVTSNLLPPQAIEQEQQEQ